MTFEYLQRVIIDAELEVENIGDCVLLGRNDLGTEFYLILTTDLGWTECIEYGPCTPEFEELPHDYTIKYSRFEYNQTKIERIIDKFLNNPKYSVSQAQVVDLTDIREFLVNPIDKVFPTNRGHIDE